jgi:hypothetical protein
LRATARWAALATLVACGGPGGTGTPPATPTSASAHIGAAGGQVATSDGSLDVYVPYGALNGDVVVTIAKVAPPADGALGAVFQVGPASTPLGKAITLTFRFASSDLAGVDPDALAVATFEDGQWRRYPSWSDRGAQTVAAQVPRFSICGVVPPGVGVDAPPIVQDGGAADAPVDAAPDGGAGVDGAAATGGKGGSGASSGMGGGGSGGQGGSSGHGGSSGGGGASGRGGSGGGGASGRGGSGGAGQGGAGSGGHQGDAGGTAGGAEDGGRDVGGTGDAASEAGQAGPEAGAGADLAFCWRPSPGDGRAGSRRVILRRQFRSPPASAWPAG